MKNNVYQVSTVVILALAISGCEGCDRCRGENGTPRSLNNSTLMVSPESLIGDMAKRGTDSATVKAGSGLYFAVGYLKEGKYPMPKISFFRWDGCRYVNEADVTVEGTGIPTFSAEKAANPAGIRNLNNFGAPELLSRTIGDCGDDSTVLTIISRDGKDRWTKVFSGCEGVRKDAKSVIESETATNGNEVIQLKSFALENGEFTLKKTEAVVWNKEAWRVYKTRNLSFPSTPIGIEPWKRIREK